VTITTRNPATGETLETYETLGEAAIDRALDRAEAAYRDWRSTSYATRMTLLGKIADAFASNRERLARQTTLEMGKTYASALAEADKCVAAFRYYATRGAEFLGDTRIDLGGGKSATARWMPHGPVLAVMPWNFPLWQVVRFLAPTIMAGNVALLKHASISMGTAKLMEEVVRKAGAPEGLFQALVIGSQPVEAIIGDDRVVAVTLTGSEGAGQAVAQAAGKALKKVVLELGGSDPFIVMPSADLDAAVETAVKARIQNTGQSCICGKRMIVHRDIYADFRDRFCEAMQAVTWGDPFDEKTDMGPLSSFDQRDTVLGQLDKLKAKGAKLLFGGEAVGDRGAFMTAGVLVDVPVDDRIAHEELFGPVAMLFEASDAEDALRIANSVPFGLGSAVFTNDADEQALFADRIETGMVAINQMLASAPEAPFGGIKRSGHGRELGPWGLHEFMNLKTITRAA